MKNDSWIHYYIISIYFTCNFTCNKSEAYLGGGGSLGHGPLLAKKKFFGHTKKIGKLGLAPLCVSTSGQRKFAPPFWNPKYATVTNTHTIHTHNNTHTISITYFRSGRLTSVTSRGVGPVGHFVTRGGGSKLAKTALRNSWTAPK